MLPWTFLDHLHPSNSKERSGPPVQMVYSLHEHKLGDISKKDLPTTH